MNLAEEFPKYDVMEELGLDPLDLGEMDKLRPKLHQMLLEDKMVESGLLGSLNDK